MNTDSLTVDNYQKLLLALLNIDESNIEEIVIFIVQSNYYHFMLIKALSIVSHARITKHKLLVDLLILLSEKDNFQDLFNLIEDTQSYILESNGALLLYDLYVRKLISYPSNKLFHEYLEVFQQYETMISIVVNDDIIGLKKLIENEQTAIVIPLHSIFTDSNLLQLAIFTNSSNSINYLTELNQFILEEEEILLYAIAGGNVQLIAEKYKEMEPPYIVRHFKIAMEYMQIELVDFFMDNNCFLELSNHDVGLLSVEYMFPFITSLLPCYVAQIAAEFSGKNESELINIESTSSSDSSSSSDDDQCDYQINEYEKNPLPSKQKNKRKSRLEVINDHVIGDKSNLRLYPHDLSTNTDEINPSKIEQRLLLNKEPRKQSIRMILKREMERNNADTEPTEESSVISLGGDPDPTTLIGRTFSTIEEMNFAINQAFQCGAQLKILPIQSEIFFAKECKAKNCMAGIVGKFVQNEWKVIHSQNHTCFKSKVGVSTQSLDEAIKKIGRREKLGLEYYTLIRKLVKDEGIKAKRITRRYLRIFSNDISSRENSWSKLPSLVNSVIASGGKAKISYSHVDDHIITFIGMSPSYAQIYVNSNAFFPVVFSDGTFLYGLGRGNLVVIVSLSGNRTVIPLCWGWGTGETLEVCSNVFSLLNSGKVETMISDAGIALNSSTKNVLKNVFQQLCAYHVAEKLSASQRFYFWKLVKAPCKMIYEQIKYKIQSEMKDMDKKLEDKYHLLSIYEDSHKNGAIVARHQSHASGAVESFNNMILNHREEEPLQLFKFIYIKGLEAIRSLLICTSDNELTPWAEKQLNSEISKLSKLAISQKHETICEIIDGNLQNATFMIDCRNQNLSCTCRKREDCGIPCSHLIMYCNEFRGGQYQNLIDKSYFIKEIQSSLGQATKLSLDFTSLINFGEYFPPSFYKLNGKKTRGKMRMDFIKEKTVS